MKSEAHPKQKASIHILLSDTCCSKRHDIPCSCLDKLFHPSLVWADSSNHRPLLQDSHPHGCEQLHGLQARPKWREPWFGSNCLSSCGKASWFRRLQTDSMIQQWWKALSQDPQRMSIQVDCCKGPLDGNRVIASLSIRATCTVRELRWKESADLTVEDTEVKGRTGSWRCQNVWLELTWQLQWTHRTHRWSSSLPKKCDIPWNVQVTNFQGSKIPNLIICFHGFLDFCPASRPRKVLGSLLGQLRWNGVLQSSAIGPRDTDPDSPSADSTSTHMRHVGVTNM